MKVIHALLPPFKRRRFWLGGSAALLLVAVVVAFVVPPWLREAVKAPLPIRVSHETTRILGPLDQEGYVDYLAAANQRASQGVTAENNAAPLFWQAVGPQDRQSPESREMIVKVLGVKDFENGGEQFVGLHEYVEARAELKAQSWPPRKSNDLSSDDRLALIRSKLPELFANEDWAAIHELLQQNLVGEWAHDAKHWREFYAAQKFPWTWEVYPTIARWLAHNESALAMLTVAASRPRYYSPFVAEPHPSLLINVVQLDHYAMFEIARVFACRAMLHLGNQDVMSAWKDALTCHRYARLAAQSPFFINMLYAYTIEIIAVETDKVIISSKRLAADQTKKILAELSSLPPLPSLSGLFDHGERFMLLEQITGMARYGGAHQFFIEPNEWGVGDIPSKTEEDRRIDEVVDWNESLATANRIHDELVAISSLPTFAQRRMALRRFASKLEPLITNTDASADSVQYDGARLAQRFVAMLMSGYERASESESRASMRKALVEIAMLLKLYRLEHGKYPESLSDLAPAYCEKLPQDQFSGQELIYRPSEIGFKLYSVGPDLADNGGVSELDWRENSSTPDDVVIELPPPFYP